MSVLLGYPTSLDASARAIAEHLAPFVRESPKFVDLPFSGYRLVSRLQDPETRDDRMQAVGDGAFVAIAGSPSESWVTCGEVLLRCCLAQESSGLADLDGAWAAAIVDRARARIHLVTDRRAQQPLFYTRVPEGLVFSTSPASFAAFLRAPKVSQEWIHEVLFFNFPLGGKSFLEGVFRVPPASILTFDGTGDLIESRQYTGRFRARPHGRQGPDGLKDAVALVRETLACTPRGNGGLYCPLSSGWDSRALLAVNRERVTRTYTYGTPLSNDLTIGSELSRQMGIPHISILFDEGFVRRLPTLCWETIYASGGLESPSRSTLLHVYRELDRSGAGRATVLSGIAAGTVLRGHAQTPSLVSADVAAMFRGAPIDERVARWHGIPRNFDSFRDRVHEAVTALSSSYGDMTEPEHHMLYTLYEVSPKYFCGEVSLASQFTHLSVPVWRRAILEWSFASEWSGLAFSEFVPSNRRGAFDEQVLQARIVASDPGSPLAALPVRSSTPNAIARGRIAYLADKSLRAVARAVGRRSGVRPSPTPLEDWANWYREELGEVLRRTIWSDDSRVASKLHDGGVERYVQLHERHAIKKLLFIEMVSRLVESGWRPVWDERGIPR